MFSACVVWITDLQDVNDNMHNLVTDVKRHLKLSDIAGLPIGHVPQKNCTLFHKRLRQSSLTPLLWYMGI